MRTTCTSSENCITLSKTNTFVHNTKKLLSRPTFFKVKDMMRLQCNVKFLLDRSDPVLAQTEHLHPQLGRLQHLDWLGQLGQLGQPYQLGQPRFERLEQDTSQNQQIWLKSQETLGRERWRSAGAQERWKGKVSCAPRLKKGILTLYVRLLQSAISQETSQERHPPHMCVALAVYRGV